MVKKNEDSKLNPVKKKRKFQVFIWNSKIQTAFVGLLVICVFLLFGAMKLQTVYIEHLEYEVMNPKSEAFDYDYNVLLSEVFLEKTGLESLNILDMKTYFEENDYENILIDIGYIEASMDQCGDGGCFEVTYRYNQNRGQYIDVVKKRLQK